MVVKTTEGLTGRICGQPFLIAACRFSHMALPAHDRPFMLFLVAPLTGFMKCLHQPRFPPFGFQPVTIRTATILGRFVLDPFTAFVKNMMALIACFDPGGFIVIVMPENRRGPFGILEGNGIDNVHVFLGVRRSDEDPESRQPGNA